MATATAKDLTTAEAAAELDVPIWRVRRLADQLLDVRRVGQYRALSRADVEMLRKALADRATK